VEQKVYFDPEGSICKAVQLEKGGGKRQGPWYLHPSVPIHEDGRGIYYRVEFPLRWSFQPPYGDQIILVTIEGEVGTVFPIVRYKQGSTYVEIYRRGRSHYIRVSAETLVEAKDAEARAMRGELLNR
jgi:hypothetical protein